MKHTLTSYIDNVLTILIYVVAGMTPLLFVNFTTEYYEMPKLLFLVVMTTILLGVWIASWIVRGKVLINRTPLDIPLLVLLGVTLLSTYFSETRFPSIYGNFPRVHGSAISIVTYILLYFVSVSQFNSLSKIKPFLYVLFGSASVVSLLSLMSFFGLFLPMDLAKVVNFTPTGSTFSTVALLLLLLPILLVSVFHQNKYVSSTLGLTLSIIFSITIILLGSFTSYIILAAIYLVTFFVSRAHLTTKNIPLAAAAAGATLLTLALAYLPFPGNVIQSKVAAFPKEIQLPFSISWKVSATAFRDAPFVGTGPATYLFNFTEYKPIEYNSQNYWNFSFDNAYNEFLQILGTLGLFGFLPFIAICAYVIVSALKSLSIESHEDTADRSQVLTAALGISSLVAIVLFTVHSSSLVSLVMSLLIMGLFLMSQKNIREKVVSLSAGINASAMGNRQFDLLPVIFFIVFLIGAVPLMYRVYQATVADYYHRLALTNANSNGATTYEYLQKAEANNPYIDLYRVDMAQTNFALANAIATQKGPTAQNEKGSLTDKDRQTIQTLISQSINEGRVAVALSQRSARNWEVLASIYRNITGVAQNALAFALDGYGKSIQRDPLNPALRVSVGGIYYSIQNYDLAIRFFSDAANLKPDYPTAYYNLSIALRDKGDLQNSQQVAEQLVNILNKNTDSADYKLAASYLKDLKARIATNSANLGDKAPAAQNESALNAPGVEVDNLTNPPQPSTPAAALRNPRTNLPQLQPSGAQR